MEATDGRVVSHAFEWEIFGNCFHFTIRHKCGFIPNYRDIVTADIREIGSLIASLQEAEKTLKELQRANVKADGGIFVF